MSTPKELALNLKAAFDGARTINKNSSQSHGDEYDESPQLHPAGRLDFFPIARSSGAWALNQVILVSLSELRGLARAWSVARRAGKTTLVEWCLSRAGEMAVVKNST